VSQGGVWLCVMWLDGKGLLMIDLYDTETDKLIGSITDTELQVLIDALEEESAVDQDYYINAATVDLLGDGRATDHLLHLLRGALGTKEGVEIRWQRR
jgi:processive 1,2-diacylglycerol beta-glucosyltransferase